MFARPEGKLRAYYCSLSIRVQAAMVAWLSFVHGIFGALLTIIALEIKRGSPDAESGTKPMNVAYISLNALLVVNSVFGIIATIELSPRFACIWSTTFQIWYYFQTAFQITVAALLFAKKLDFLVPECGFFAQSVRFPYEICEQARSRVILTYTLVAMLMVVGGYFVIRGISRFSRHCVEQATTSPQITGVTNSAPAQMSSPNGQEEYSASYQPLAAKVV
ncbi:unnamed protein product [Rhizoctonia solani]|uniref:Uncharacterized protein n=1 Tax=Rhizoctonia solani TaxID=456999 RepID=A0A8H3D125_9AGAM|nr:unnamed protein product [Rhizoctonia solani]